MTIPGGASPLLLSSAAADGAYEISRSVRFNSSDSALGGGKKAIPMPDHAELKAMLNYDPETGVFTRAKSTSANAKKGSVAGYRSQRGYLRVTVCNKKYLGHRLAWYYMTGEDPGDMEVDHINRDTTDNRFCNLRLISQQGNSINCSMRSHNTSGVRGVYWDKQMNKWGAQIRNQGKKIHLGYHVELEDAKCAYDKAALEIHGQYAVTNAMLQEVA